MATGMWRFMSRLPIERASDIVSLGEGDTPVVDLSAGLGRELGLAGLRLKLEDRNPTGSFKARIASVAASLVRARDLNGLVGTSSGNGGAAAAAYAAAAGSSATLFTLSDIVAAKLLEIVATGATAYRVRGVGYDAASTMQVVEVIAEAAHRQRFYPMLTGYQFAPEAMCGVESIAWELQETDPDATVVFAPVGGGGLLTGLHRGFAHDAGSNAPRLIGVHPTGAAGLARAIEGQLSGIDGPVTTTISGLQMAVLFDPATAAAAVLDSGGHATAVSDDDIWAAQELLARQHGILVEPAGATALAGVLADARGGRLRADDLVVAIVTGAGYKDTAALARLARGAPVTDLDNVADVVDVLAAFESLARNV